MAPGLVGVLGLGAARAVAAAQRPEIRRTCAAWPAAGTWSGRSWLRLVPPALLHCSTAARVSVASAHPTLDCDRLLQVLQVLQVFQVLQVLQVPVQRLAAPDTNSDSLFYIQQTD